MNGWFPIQHDIVDSPAFQDADSLRLFVWLSQRAAIKKQHVAMTTGRGQSVVSLQRGQCIVGRKKGGESLGWTEARFRYRLEKLEEWGLITREVTTHWSVINIVNYGVSEDGEGEEQPTKHHPSNQPNTTQATNQTPQMKIPKMPKNQKIPKKPKDSCADKSAASDSELIEMIDFWNRLKAKQLVSAKTSTKPNKGVLAGWKRVQRSPELQALVSDLPAIEDAIRKSDFVRGSWFTLEKLLGGSNKDGAYVVQKLLDGGYADNGIGSGKQRTANVGPGVIYDPNEKEYQNATF